MTDFITGVFPSAIKAIQTTRKFKANSDFDAHDLRSSLTAFQSFKNTLQVPEHIHWLKQVHGHTVVHADCKTDEPEADASFTDLKRQVCVVMTADCLPVLISNKQATWVAAVHCGWRGLFQNILSQTIKKYPGQTSDLMAWLGPCIRRSAYQVDETFAKNFLDQQPEMVDAFDPIIGGHTYADLPLIATEQMQALGIHQISDSHLCTHENQKTFHSWRRDQSPLRLASMIWIDR